MNKRMQKLLSVFMAGLFVLQSASLVATGVFAEDAGTAEVVKHTPTLDAKLDDQYKKSYKTELDTSVLRLRKTGNAASSAIINKYAEFKGDMAATAYYLWDDGYIYVYADVTDSTVPTAEVQEPMYQDIITFAVWNGNAENYDTTSAEVVINGERNYAFANTKGDTAVASNFSKAYGTTTESTEYVTKVKNDGSGYIVEARIKVDGLTADSTVNLALGGNDKVATYEMCSFGFIYDKDDSTSAAYKTVKLAGPRRLPGEFVIKATAAIDGQMDEAYNKTYFMTGDHTEVNFLWDDGYYYMYAVIDDSTAANGDILYLSLQNKDKNNPFWSEACALEFDLNNGTAKHTIEFGDAYKGVGYNFALSGATEPTPATEYSITRTESGYIVEARIANTTMATGKEIDFGYGVKNDGAWYDGLGNNDTATWQELYNNKKGTIITCGAGIQSDDNPTEGNIVKKGTPELDGRLDGIYKDSYKIDTIELIKEHNLKTGWVNDVPQLVKDYYQAGLIAENSDKSQFLLADGKLDSDFLVHAEIYFLWDDDALYIFTKVYDNEILDVCAETGCTPDDLVTAVGASDLLLCNESLIHDVIPLQNQELAMRLGANPAGTYGDQKACAGYENRDQCEYLEGVSEISDWVHVSEISKRNNLSNFASEYHIQDGYYTVELRIPITERDYAGTTIKNQFLHTGEKFDYGLFLYDARTKAFSSSFSGASAQHFMQLQMDKNITMVLSGEEAKLPDCEHEWNTEFTIEKAATCTEPGERSIHCSICDEVKPGSVEVIEPLGHNYVDGICTRCHKVQPVTAKKYTPSLDGVLDEAYLDSGSIKASELAKNGKLSLGWCNSENTIGKLVDAGILSDANSSALLPGGDYTSSAFADAEVYFLWDDDALYIYSKVYDDDILDIASAEYFKGDASSLYTINGDYPWINDIVTHTINPLANQFAVITASGDAYGHYAWDNSNKDGGGWSGLCYFQNSSADQRIASAENVKTTVNLEENWYGVELRIPITDKDFGGTPLKDALLKDGGYIDYKYQLTDGVKKPFGSSFKGFQCEWWMIYVSEALRVDLSGEAPHTEHVWAEDYTVDVAPTCTEAGSKSIHCTHPGCQVIKPDSTVEIEALGHDWSEEYTVDTPATCTTVGSESIHCKRCDAQKPDSAREIPLAKHTYKDGKCEVCGHVNGDVNGDGQLDTADLVRLMKYIAADGKDIEAKFPDVNEDGEVTTADLVRMMKMIAAG